MAELPQGLRLLGEGTPPEDGSRNVAPQQQAETAPVPDGLRLLENPFISSRDKLSREMEHKEFVPGLSMTDDELEELKDNAPAVAGGIAGGILTGGSGFAVGAAGAFIGGFMGETAKDIYNYIYDPEKAPKDFNERRASQFKAGGEELVAELGGRAVSMVAGKAYHVLQPKAKAGIDALRKQFDNYGGKFTLNQQTDSFLVEQVDSLTRGSLTGKGIMKAGDEVNDIALNRWRDDLSNVIARDAKKHMGDAEFGKLMASTLSDGRVAFKSYIGELYNGFDELVKTEIRKGFSVKEFPSSIVDVNGRALVNKHTEEVIQELRPVDIRPLKEKAAALSLRLQESANLGKSEFGGTTIDKVLQLDDALKFSTAQEARSILLDLSRAAQASGEAKLSGSLKALSGEITTAMDDAAKRQGSEAFLKYQAIKREAEQGYKAFNSQLTYNLLKDDANLSKFANELFKEGNVDKIHQFRRSLNEAAKHDPRIDAGGVMDQVKQNYLERVLNKSTQPLEMEPGELVKDFTQKAGVPNAANLSKFFGEDHKRATMNALFSPREQQALFDFGTALQVVQNPNEAGLGMVMQLTQAGVAINAVQGKEGAIRRAAAFFLPTELMAKIMTNPTTVSLMTSAAKTPMWAKQAPTITTKLILMIKNAREEAEGKETLAEDVGNYLKDAGTSVLGLEE